MADRGEYRAIRRVLLDGKDFRKLTERARFVFLALKLNLGPSGIETYEPEAVVHTLAAQTGAKPDQVRTALDVLEHHGWIKREDNVLWIVGQLEHDPHVKQADVKHRRMVQRHVAGLPRLAIVRSFIVAHATWFDDIAEATKGLPDESDTPSKPLLRAIEGGSQGHRSTEDKKEKEKEPHTEGGAAPRAGVAADVERVVAHRRSLSPTSRPDDKQREAIRRALVRFEYGAEDLCAALTGAYHDEWCQKTGNHGIPYVFRDAATIDRYIAKGEAAYREWAAQNDPTSVYYVGVLPGGVMSLELDRLTQPA